MISKHITRIILISFCLMVLMALAQSSIACTPESYFLFRSEAEQRLDSLNANPTEGNTLERFILMHNLAFHKDKQQRENAEKLLKKAFPEKNREPIVKAYAGSLKMIKVSHRSIGSKAFRTVNPLTKSPYSEGREGYRKISEALAQDTTNAILRILRATAAAESAEHLNELFDSAKIDLEWIQIHQNSSDSVCLFLLHLNWAKYHFKLAKLNKRDYDSVEAERHCKLAIDYACTPEYLQWANDWLVKIREYNIPDKVKN